MKEPGTERPSTGLTRLEELLEEFLAASAEARERFLFARHQVSEEVRGATEQLVGQGDTASPSAPLAALAEIPAKAVAALEGGAGFYRLWGTAGPPELAVAGNEPVTPERQRRVLALLRMGLECRTREEGVEVLDRLAEAREEIPGLDHDFTCWLYLLSPTVFPPLPAGLYPGAAEALGGAHGLKETTRKLWAFADKHALLLETDDLAVPAAFFQWLSERGASAWARPRSKRPYYGSELLISETMLAPAFVERLVREVQATKMLLFTGPSGCGKTYSALRFSRFLVRDGGNAEVLRAHPALGYAELVGFHPTPGVLLQLAAAASRDPAGSYVLYLDAIDEIDVERLFGDLLLSFEYPDEQLTTAGGFRFSFPPNLHLLATARRSWEELLQEHYSVYRLFSHARFSPDPLKLAEFFNRRGNPIKQIDVLQCFRKLNRLLLERTGGAFQVGHGYLMIEGLTDGNLASYWDTYIIPYIRSVLADPKQDYEVFRLARLT